MEDLRKLRDEINYKLALLANLQLKILHHGVEHTKAHMTPEAELQLAGEIGFDNFTDFVRWRQRQLGAQANPEANSRKRRPDVPW